MKGSWDFANEVALPAYQIVTEFDDCRFPATDEVRNVASKNYTDYAFPESVNLWTNAVVTWTSDGNNSWRYLDDLGTGETHKTCTNQSLHTKHRPDRHLLGSVCAPGR